MKSFLITILLTVLLIFSCQPMGVKKEKIKAPSPLPKEAAPPPREISPPPVLTFENDSVTSTTNIHYTGKYCNECHEKTPVKGGNTYLRFGGRYEQLCRCHTQTHTVLIHPFDIEPSPEKLKRMPADFALQNGKVTCGTCHDLYLQCEKRLFNRNSLRGAPYSKRTDFCFNCHEKKRYEKLNPHDQISDTGEIIIEKCLFCHKEKPDEKHATFKDVKFIGDIETLCRRCHLIAGNHAGDFDHMGVVPSAKGLKRMEAMREKYDLILPLDENGKMTCITCHNPHEKGVIPADKPGAKGAGSKYRHRLPGRLCKECHQM